MQKDNIVLPKPEQIKSHCISALSCYWKNASDKIHNLPINSIEVEIEAGESLTLVEVQLPDWAVHCGVNNKILVPKECINQKLAHNNSWENVDWFLAIFLLLECWHERLWEKKHGPIHSYSVRLKNWDSRAWDYAWVNRIGIFLIEWAKNISKDDIQFDISDYKIHMTHDVDAVSKTLSIRLKQSVFISLNIVRSLIKADFGSMLKNLKKLLKFSIGFDNWDVFDNLFNKEREAGIIAKYHFYADKKPKNFKRWLFDPGYSLDSTLLQNLFNKLLNEGHEIGLHPSYDSWNSYREISSQKDNLERNSGKKLDYIRQHWLRFSWNKTWSCQEKAGLKIDTTLMFNDRPGFRNSSMLRWKPWNTDTNSNFKLEAIPSILMDSHLYDYLQLKENQIEDEIKLWIDECKVVSGQAAVLWHPHTLSVDYGWSKGFEKLLKQIK